MDLEMAAMGYKVEPKDTKQVAEPLYKLPVNPATSKMSRESSFKPNAIPDESMANAELGGDSINERRLPSASTFGIAVSAEASDDEKSFFLKMVMRTQITNGKVTIKSSILGRGKALSKKFHE